MDVARVDGGAAGVAEASPKMTSPAPRRTWSTQGMEVTWAMSACRVASVAPAMLKYQ